MDRYIHSIFVLLGLLMVTGCATTGWSGVIAMSEAGVDDEVIIAKIRTSQSAFHLSADQIIELKEAGVNEQVIKAMVQTHRDSYSDRRGGYRRNYNYISGYRHGYGGYYGYPYGHRRHSGHRGYPYGYYGHHGYRFFLH